MLAHNEVISRTAVRDRFIIRELEGPNVSAVAFLILSPADMSDASELSLRIILKTPPAGIDYALQKGRGSGYETFQKQRSTGKDLIFEFTVAVKAGRTTSFSGPFVQGASGDKFVYIDIGRYAGQQDTECARRLKVPLSGITADMIKAGKLLQATIPGTGKDGTPNCASIWRKQVPDWGWKAVRKR